MGSLYDGEMVEVAEPVYRQLLEAASRIETTLRFLKGLPALRINSSVTDRDFETIVNQRAILLEEALAAIEQAKKLIRK